MSHRRAKRLRTLGFHAEYGANYPAAWESRKKVEAMQPSPRERRRIERYNDFKINKVMNAEHRFNVATHDDCSCAMDNRGFHACPIWLHREEEAIKKQEH